MSARLSVSGIRIAYTDRERGERCIFDDFDLQLERGMFVCIAGRSGSGKTSLLRCLVGLQAPDSGTISWDGGSIESMTEDARADLRRTRVAYVDQAATLVEELTVQDNLVLPAVPDGRRAIQDAVQRSAAPAAVLGIDSLMAARPNRLSGGERQRVAMARALATSASTIIADEPTASLDRGWADVVIAELRSAAQAGRAILVASHDPGVAAEADLVITIDENAARSGTRRDPPIT